MYIHIDTLMVHFLCGLDKRGDSNPAETGDLEAYKIERGGAEETPADAGAESGGGEPKGNTQESDHWTKERQEYTNSHTHKQYFFYCFAILV